MEPTKDPNQRNKSAVERTEEPGKGSTVVLWFSRLFVVALVGIVAFLLGSYEKNERASVVVREQEETHSLDQDAPPPSEEPLVFELPTSVPEPTSVHAPTSVPRMATEPEITFNSELETDLPQALEQESKLPLPDLARIIHPSVVSIVGLDSNGNAQSSGTGFVVREDGLIATNRHVVEEASTLKVQTSSGSYLTFKGVQQHSGTADVILLKVAENGLPVLELEKTPTFEVGDSIAVVGSPLGLDGTLSAGIVSAIRMDKPIISGMSGVSTQDAGFIQISAPISPGSSGSPVVNESGKVIGIATAKIKGGENLNVALPIRHVLYLLVVTGDNVPVPLHMAFPRTELPSSEPPLPSVPSPAEENHGELAAKIAFLYLELGDSGHSLGQGENWYADPVDYFDEGVISRTKALEIERKYEDRWPIRIHRPLDIPKVEELETGKWGVEITSLFAISDGKRQFKQMVVTTGLVIDMATTRRVESVKTVRADSKALNKFQFRKLFGEIVAARAAQGQ